MAYLNAICRRKLRTILERLCEPSPDISSFALLTPHKDREDLDKYPSEPPDFSHEDPKHPHKTDYQREVCRRRKAQGRELKSAVLIPVSSWKGHK